MDAHDDERMVDADALAPHDADALAGTAIKTNNPVILARPAEPILFPAVSPTSPAHLHLHHVQQQQHQLHNQPQLQNHQQIMPIGPPGALAFPPAPTPHSDTTPEDYENAVPDHGQDVRAKTTFRWLVQDWEAMRSCTRSNSPEFECAGLRWRFLIFPNGNKGNDFVSIFLESVDALNFQTAGKVRWHACVSFCIFAVNPTDETVLSKNNIAQHRFSVDATDWGFSTFAKTSSLAIPAEGATKPVIQDNSVIFVVSMKVLEDPFGTLWNNFQDWNSREETGYIGLRNQGATCYLNSLLQSLYFTNYFRKATFQIPTENDDPKKSVPLALQRLFYNMQNSPNSIGTTELTKSFGWDTSDAFLQHDVQELNRVLQDNLESKMKNTAAEGAIRKLFTGRMKSFVKCVNVDFESSRIEDFYDIQLNVKGCKNLHDSFVEYCSIEMLDGDNKYFAEGHGLQDAKKGVIFKQFPPVLHLQLKRFEYDIERDALVKMNDRHEFPLTIDLDEFLETPDASVSQRYHLHGVLVHSGELHAGHYCAFIRPEKAQKWFKFDDDRVIPVSIKEVLEDNYGGDLVPPVSAVPGAQPTPRMRLSKRFTNAYMLVYIRESDADEMLAPISASDIPDHLRRRFDEERALAEQRQKDEEEAHLYTTIRVLTDDTIRTHEGYDLCFFDETKGGQPPSNFLHVRLRKTDPFTVLMSKVASELHIKDENLRLWSMTNRQNKTIRLDMPVTDTLFHKTVDEVKFVVSKSNELRLYAEVVETPVSDEVVTVNDVAMTVPVYFYPRVVNIIHPYALIFIKFYDPVRQKLEYLGTHHVTDVGMPISTILPTLCGLKELPIDTNLWVYEEVKQGMVELVDLNMTYKLAELQDGDILCFQLAVTDEDRVKVADPELIEAPKYYEYLSNRVSVTFKVKDRGIPGKGDFDATMSRKMSYDAVVAELARLLDYDPNKLRLWSSSSSGVVAVPKSVIRRSSVNTTLNEMLGSSFYHTGTNTIFYEMLNVSIIEFETKRYVKVLYTDAVLKEEGPYDLLVLKNAMYGDVIDAIVAKVGYSGSVDRIRLFEITTGRITRMFQPTEPITNCPESALILAEEIGVGESEMGDVQDVVTRLVPAMHFSRDPLRYHGTPFTFMLRANETVTQLRQRLQSRTSMTDKDFAKVKLVQVRGVRIVRAFDDGNEVVVMDDFGQSDHLGLDHPDKSGKSSRMGMTEKSIKIFN